MGLAGPRKRTKISHDPNNTRWSRDTNSYGHKILAAQGWQPGQYLGAKDANHAAHYTVASASHVKALLKDDNLGLGAKLGADSAETFGLSLFSGILGRLNGKSDEVAEKEQQAQRDVKLALYQGRKIGQVMFVSAGYLVGDKIEDIPASRVVEKMETVISSASPPDDSDQNRGTKRKRKTANTEPGMGVQLDKVIQSLDAEKTAPGQQRTGPSKLVEGTESTTVLAAGAADTESKEQRRERRRKRKEEKAKRKEGELSAADDSEIRSKSQRRAEKRERKEERRKRKEERRARKASKSAAGTDAASSSSSDSDASTSKETVPAVVQAAARFVGRQAVRQRYIQQKRMAALDPQALKEIFMVTTGA